MFLDQNSYPKAYLSHFQWIPPLSDILSNCTKISQDVFSLIAHITYRCSFSKLPFSVSLYLFLYLWFSVSIWVEGSLYSRIDLVKFFKGYLPQILPGPFLYTLPIYRKRSMVWKVFCQMALSSTHETKSVIQYGIIHLVYTQFFSQKLTFLTSDTHMYVRVRIRG